ncbi:MAG: hypothetical protein H7222_11270 [Methylotenera sp.]|nr:hypothetical protein [Oligoflexia bacterium]
MRTKSNLFSRWHTGMATCVLLLISNQTMASPPPRTEKSSATELQALLGARQLPAALGTQSPIAQIVFVSSDPAGRVIYQISNGRCTLRVALQYQALAKYPSGPVFPTWSEIVQKGSGCP